VLTTTASHFSAFFTQTNKQRNIIFANSNQDDNSIAAQALERVTKYPIIQVFKDTKLERQFLSKHFYSQNYRRFIIADLIVLTFMLIFVFIDYFSTDVPWRYYTVLALRVVTFPFFIFSLICKCLVPCVRRTAILAELITAFAVLVGYIALNIATAMRYQGYVEKGLSGFPDGTTMVLICGAIVYRYVLQQTNIEQKQLNEITLQLVCFF